MEIPPQLASISTRTWLSIRKDERALLQSWALATDICIQAISELRSRAEAALLELDSEAELLDLELQSLEKNSNPLEHDIWLLLNLQALLDHSFSAFPCRAIAGIPLFQTARIDISEPEQSRRFSILLHSRIDQFMSSARSWIVERHPMDEAPSDPWIYLHSRSMVFAAQRILLAMAPFFEPPIRRTLRHASWLIGVIRRAHARPQFSDW
jgi:hypothetical protein